MTLKRLLYVSESRLPADRDGFRASIAQIMAQSQAHNSVDSITGVLAHERGHFIQLVEGRSGRVDALLDRLFADPRHRHLTVRLDEAADERLFPRWSMALVDMTQAPLPEHEPGRFERMTPDAMVDYLRAAAKENAVLDVPVNLRP